MLELELTVKGQVQRVGYRYSLYKYLLESHPTVVGFVQNMGDGSVLIKVYGELETLRQIREFAINGIDRAIVRDTQETIKPVSSDDIEFVDFAINE